MQTAPSGTRIGRVPCAGDIAHAAEAVGAEVGGFHCRAGALFGRAHGCMKTVESQLSHPLLPGESSKPRAKEAYCKACSAAGYLQSAASGVRKGAELVEAGAANHPGQASAKAASGTAVRGENTVIPASLSSASRGSEGRP